MASGDDVLVMGRVAAPFGVRGWVHIHSYTAAPDSLLDYAPWYLRQEGRWRPTEVLAGRPHGKGLVVQLEGCDDRDAADLLKGAEIGVYRSQLPPAAADEYYWSDLVGLRMIDAQARELGVIDHLIETGANDVMVVKGEREILVPYIRDQVVKSVDLDAGVIRVDWDPDY